MQTPPPFRVDAQPTLGVSMISVAQQGPTIEGTLGGFDQPSRLPFLTGLQTLPIQPREETDRELLVALSAKVDALREDVRLLRADLAARTWSARWQRFTVWLRAFFKE